MAVAENNTLRTIRRRAGQSVLLLVASGLVSVTGYAATVACPTATGTATTTTPPYPNVTAVTVPGEGATGSPEVIAATDNALTNLNTQSGAANFTTGGCLVTDMSFNNFRVTTSATTMSVDPSGGINTSDGAKTEANFYAAMTPELSGASAIFSGVRGNAGNNSDTNQNDGTKNFFNSGTTNIVFNFLFTLDAGAGTTLTGSSLSMRYYNFTNDPRNSVTVYLCGNYNTGGSVQTAAFTTCAATGGTLASYTQSLAGLSNTNNDLVTLASTNLSGLDFSRVYVNIELTLNGDTALGGTNSYLYDVGIGFTETPEPSTFAMMGLALMGGGLLYRRRRS